MPLHTTRQDSGRVSLTSSSDTQYSRLPHWTTVPSVATAALHAYSLIALLRRTPQKCCVRLNWQSYRSEYQNNRKSWTKLYLSLAIVGTHGLTQTFLLLYHFSLLQSHQQKESRATKILLHFTLRSRTCFLERPVHAKQQQNSGRHVKGIACLRILNIPYSNKPSNVCSVGTIHEFIGVITFNAELINV